MTHTLAATIIAFLFSALGPVLAQTTAPGSAGTGTTGAGGATGAESVADWWWVILVVIAIGAAIWYFTSRRGRV
jgi:hypothetical protein